MTGDRRIWIVFEENGWQRTKLNDNVSKLIDQRRNWNEYSHIPECPRTKLENTFLIEWRGHGVDENGRENLYMYRVEIERGVYHRTEERRRFTEPY